MPTVKEQVQYLREIHKNPLFTKSLILTPHKSPALEIHVNNSLVLLEMIVKDDGIILNTKAPKNIAILRSNFSSDKEYRRRQGEEFTSLSLKTHSRIGVPLFSSLFIGETLALSFSRESSDGKVNLQLSSTIPINVHQLTGEQNNLLRDALIPFPENDLRRKIWG